MDFLLAVYTTGSMNALTYRTSTRLLAVMRRANIERSHREQAIYNEDAENDNKLNITL
jgi:hypothetical protein